MSMRQEHDQSAEGFSLKRRRDGGSTPRLSDWGAADEVSLLTDVLLGPPANLKHLPTSSLSRRFLRDAPCDIAVAQDQHRELVAAYEHFGVRVHFQIEDPDLPMQVYTRDSSFMTPYGPVITNMCNWWRRGENFVAIRTYEQLGIPIYDMVTAGHFEGGDFSVIEPGTVLIGCGGERSQDEAVQQIKGWFEAEGWEVKTTSFDPFYVHIDLMVVMLAEKLAAVCLECTAPDIVDWLKAKKIEILPVPFQDTMNLGCNVMSLGKDRIIAPKHSRALIDQLKARGFEVAEIDTSEISKTGGGIHCMAQALRRERS